MSKSFKKTQKTREHHIEDVLVDLEEDLANFQLTVNRKTRVGQDFKTDETRLSKTISREQIIKRKNKLN